MNFKITSEAGLSEQQAVQALADADTRFQLSDDDGSEVLCLAQYELDLGLELEGVERIIRSDYESVSSRDGPEDIIVVEDNGKLLALCLVTISGFFSFNCSLKSTPEVIPRGGRKTSH